MIPAIDAGMLAASSSLAASILTKVTVTTALALAATWIARRNRAAVRHALLAAAFGVLLVLPVVSIIAPPIRIAVRTAQSRSASRLAPAAAIPSAPAHLIDGVAPAAPPSAGPSLSALLLAAWLAGVALFLLPVAIGLWQVRSLRRSALVWQQGRSIAGKLALDAGIHRRVEVVLHDALPGPVTCGVLRPAIVLPQDAPAWDPTT